jgi:L,D-peptidoglycan transpeptidase YkuD (ErfK/YbiS/YcfS/YnhG family)
MDLIVTPDHKGGWHARQDDQLYACALGRNGVVPAAEKREGDGASPLGHWHVQRVLYRPDRGAPPDCLFSRQEIRACDGWCDAPEDRNYNQQVALPYRASHEVLWRDDRLYDVLVVLDHNSDPTLPGRGSAIFLHCAKPGYPPTAGCVALARPDLEAVLKRFELGDAVVISQTPSGPGAID